MAEAGDNIILDEGCKSDVLEQNKFENDNTTPPLPPTDIDRPPTPNTFKPETMSPHSQALTSECFEHASVNDIEKSQHINQCSNISVDATLNTSREQTQQSNFDDSVFSESNPKLLKQDADSVTDKNNEPKKSSSYNHDENQENLEQVETRGREELVYVPVYFRDVLCKVKDAGLSQEKEKEVERGETADQTLKSAEEDSWEDVTGSNLPVANSHKDIKTIDDHLKEMSEIKTLLDNANEETRMIASNLHHTHEKCQELFADKSYIEIETNPPSSLAMSNSSITSHQRNSTSMSMPVNSDATDIETDFLEITSSSLKQSLSKNSLPPSETRKTVINSRHNNENSNDGQMSPTASLESDADRSSDKYDTKRIRRSIKMVASTGNTVRSIKQLDHQSASVSPHTPEKSSCENIYYKTDHNFSDETSVTDVEIAISMNEYQFSHACSNLAKTAQIRPMISQRSTSVARRNHRDKITICKSVPAIIPQGFKGDKVKHFFPHINNLVSHKLDLVHGQDYEENMYSYFYETSRVRPVDKERFTFTAKAMKENTETLYELEPIKAWIRDTRVDYAPRIMYDIDYCESSTDVSDILRSNFNDHCTQTRDKLSDSLSFDECLQIQTLTNTNAVNPVVTENYSYGNDFAEIQTCVAFVQSNQILFITVNQEDKIHTLSLELSYVEPSENTLCTYKTDEQLACVRESPIPRDVHPSCTETHPFYTGRGGTTNSWELIESVKLDNNLHNDSHSNSLTLTNITNSTSADLQQLSNSSTAFFSSEDDILQQPITNEAGSPEKKSEESLMARSDIVSCGTGTKTSRNGLCDSYVETSTIREENATVQSTTTASAVETEPAAEQRDGNVPRTNPSYEIGGYGCGFLMAVPEVSLEGSEPSYHMIGRDRMNGVACSTQRGEVIVPDVPCSTRRAEASTETISKSNKLAVDTETTPETNEVMNTRNALQRQDLGCYKKSSEKVEEFDSQSNTANAITEAIKQIQARNIPEHTQAHTARKQPCEKEPITELVETAAEKSANKTTAQKVPEKTTNLKEIETDKLAAKTSSIGKSVSKLPVRKTNRAQPGKNQSKTLDNMTSVQSKALEGTTELKETPQNTEKQGVSKEILTEKKNAVSGVSKTQKNQSTTQNEQPSQVSTTRKKGNLKCSPATIRTNKPMTARTVSQTGDGLSADLKRKKASGPQTERYGSPWKTSLLPSQMPLKISSKELLKKAYSTGRVSSSATSGLFTSRRSSGSCPRSTSREPPSRSARSNSLTRVVDLTKKTTLEIETDITTCADKIRERLSRREHQAAFRKLYKEELVSNTLQFRENNISFNQLLKVLSIFEPEFQKFSIKNRQQIAAKLVPDRGRVNIKTIIPSDITT